MKSVETKKLYKVTLRGLTGNYGRGMCYGVSYVVADNSDEAYKKVKEFLDDEDIGYNRDRELLSIELLAEDLGPTNVGTILFL